MAARGLALFAAAALLLGGCGGGEDEPPAPTQVAATPSPTATPAASPTPSPTAGADCDEDFAAEPSKPPADNVVEVPGYFHVYRYENPPGKVERWYAVLDGTPEELSFRRDDAMNFMVQNAGYAPVSNAFKEGVRASAKLESPDHKAEIVVTIPCAGKFKVRYTIS